MQKVGLFVKQDPKALETANRFESWLTTRGVQVLRRSGLQPGSMTTVTTVERAPADLYCMFVLGGDGTFLSAVRWIGNQDIPVLGVKFGEIGFLADTAEGDLFAAAQFILEKELRTESRMRLEVRILRDGSERFRETVLNDVVITKGAIPRLAHIRTYIDAAYLTTYRADGLIIATPTGSTAYSLAAGGPIIYPAVPAMILAPICPFTLTNRPLILPDTFRVELQLDEKTFEALLTADGQTGMEITASDRIVVGKSPHPIRVITLPDRRYFEVLKEKLRWSGGRT